MKKIVLTIWILSASALLTIFAASTDGNKQIVEYSYHLEPIIDEMQHNLSSCINLTKQIEAETIYSSYELDNCKNRMNMMDINLSVTTGIFEKEIQYLRYEIEQHQDSLNSAARKLLDLEGEKNDLIANLETKYQILASNSAHNICCKAKIDNPKISFYTIIQNKINCGEVGSNILSC